jgi:tRNA modification GTPase
MFAGDRDQDTICAVSSPAGIGGVSLIRISGPNALKATKKIARFLPSQPESHKIYFGKILSLDGQEIDESLVSFFKQGKSYTGEETLEISCHGNPLISRNIIRALVDSGCRPAEKGEFTYRAFMNGKLDLVQAESVQSLIHSQSESAINQSLRQLGGEFSKKLKNIENDLIWCLAHLEASIDFSTEDIEVVSDELLNKKFSSITSNIKEILRSYKHGKVLSDGIKVSLIGRPNVGKSSILNLLAEEDKAIVSSIPGTTRDTVEAHFFVSGIKIQLVDTAGIRETADEIEKKGIEKSYKAINDSDLVFFVADISEKLSSEEIESFISLAKKSADKAILFIGNKKDLGEAYSKDKISKELNHDKEKVIFITTKDENSKIDLVESIKRALELNNIQDETHLYQARHYENLTKTLSNLEAAASLLKNKQSSEFLALEMKEALLYIQQTLGIKYDDQILDRVFKEFCLGK